MIKKSKLIKVFLVAAAAFFAFVALGGTAAAVSSAPAVAQQESRAQYLPYNNMQGLYLPYN